MANSTIDCPCEWEGDFGALTCEKQMAGVDTCLVVLCATNVTDIAILDCDDTNPASSGQIVGVTKATGEKGTRFFTAENVTDIQSGKTLNDNDSVEINETIVTRGTVGAAETCYLEAHFGKKVLVFFIDKQENVWCMGYDDGLRITEFNRVWGITTADTIGTDVTWSNTSGNIAKKVDYVSAGFASGALFMDSLLTP